MTARSERVELMLRLSHVTADLDPTRWRVDGRPLTSEELRLLDEVSPDDIADAWTLVRLGRDVRAAFEKHLGDG